MSTLALLVVGLVAVGASAASAADDVGVVDERTGIWYLRDTSTGETTSFYYGNPADIPFVGDWDCDGVETPGLYRQSDGFVYLRNSNSQGVADIKFYFGNPGDIPLAGDFDNDGCDTVSIYRPSETAVYVINKLGEDGKGLGAAELSYRYGYFGDIPIVGDEDGDGYDTVSLLRRATDQLFVNNSLTPSTDSVVTVTDGATAMFGRWPAQGAVGTFGAAYASFSLPDREPFEYGSPDMIPIAGDFGPLPGGDDPPPTPPPYPDVGSGKRIIYSNSEQRLWMIDENDQLVDTYLVTGRQGIPYNGTYAVWSKSVNAWAPYGGITMKHMVRFVRPGTWGNRWSYGFHSIPRYPNGQPMQTAAELGAFGSGGCIRQPDYKAAILFDWAEMGTVVHAIP